MIMAEECVVIDNVFVVYGGDASYNGVGGW